MSKTKKKSTNIVNATGNDVGKVRIENKKNDDDNAGGDAVMGDFGVDSSNTGSTPLPTVMDVSSSSENDELAVDAVLKLFAIVMKIKIKKMNR